MGATYGHRRMSFLNAFQGYHQIALALKDQDKTSFISPEGNYHYTFMTFRLKNIGATYQQMVEVYIDNMVVKRKVPEDHV